MRLLRHGLSSRSRWPAGRRNSRPQRVNRGPGQLCCFPSWHISLGGSSSCPPAERFVPANARLGSPDLSRFMLVEQGCDGLLEPPEVFIGLGFAAVAPAPTGFGCREP